jgi:FdhE protein
MAYVALEPATRLSLQASAAARWEAVSRSQPHLGPAVALQRELVGLQITLLDAVENNGVPELPLGPDEVGAKLVRGVPAIAGEPIRLPEAILGPALLEFCGLLSRGGAGEAAEHVRAALVSARVHSGSLLAASLGRNRKAIQMGAVHYGLSPDLVWLAAELAVSPVAHALHCRAVTPEASPAVAAALDQWRLGFCPSCGSWPALAEAGASGPRVLRCSFCALAWSLPSAGCVYCATQEPTLETVTAGGQSSQSLNLELCSACGGYLKVIEASELSPFPLLAISDLETSGLDLEAAQRGFNRPHAREFAVERQPATFHGRG